MKRVLVVLAALALGLAAAGGIAYATNGVPVVAQISSSDPAIAARPYVIKLHAKWCPVCMISKGTWSEIADKYEGKVNLVVFDVTNDAARAASAAEAKRLGLQAFFAERGDVPGTITVLDPGTRAERVSMDGTGKVEDFFAHIDASLKAPKPR